MPDTLYQCKEWYENSNGWFLCSQLEEVDGVARIVVETADLAAPFGAGFGLVLVSAAFGVTIGALIKLVK